MHTKTLHQKRAHLVLADRWPLSLVAPASTSVLWLRGRASGLVTRRLWVRQLLWEVLRFFLSSQLCH